jgi:predicted nucleic acid-binding protein
MTADYFLDTNILLYSGSKSLGDSGKRAVAEKIVYSLDFAISTQVVQEYISNALNKKALGLSTQNVEDFIRSLDAITVLPVTLPLIRSAWRLRSRFLVSHWDATIIAAARELGCHTLYTEDFNHGQDYDGVRVMNPFL